MKIIKIILFLSLGICREVEFREIQLSGLITDKKQEISGLPGPAAGKSGRICIYDSKGKN